MLRSGCAAIAKMKAAAKTKVAEMRKEGRWAVIDRAPGLALSMETRIAEPWIIINE